MNEQFNAAMDKLRDEMATMNGNGLAILGERLCDRLTKEPAIAEKILVNGKTLSGGFGTIREYARKHQSHGMAVVSDEDAWKLLLTYYGITEDSKPSPAPAPADDLDIDDLLGGL